MFQFPLNVCTYGQEEIDAVLDVLKSERVTMGEQCRLFEEEFAAKIGVKEAVFVNSGSSANLLAWFALTNPHFGRLLPSVWEVIVPAVGWSTTYWPIIQAGGVPVLVDCDPLTLQMDIESMRKALTRKTVAICPVHVLGNAVDMDEVVRFAEDNNLFIVEDACEALGTKYRNRSVGTFGQVGTFSFYFSHHITSIEGGMVVTNDRRLADVMRMMRSHGWSKASSRRESFEKVNPRIDPNFFFVTTGFNLRPTEINAAIGRTQFRKLDAFNRRRNDIAKFWNEQFSDVRSFQPTQITEGTTPAWFGYPVMCSSEGVRNRLRTWMNNEGIETRPIVSGNMARQPGFIGLPHRVSGGLTESDKATDRGLLWGLHPNLTDDDALIIAETAKAFGND